MTTEGLLKKLFRSTALPFIACAALGGSGMAQTGAPADLPESYDGPASAVAALVNDSVITTFDVQQRMQMMLISAGGRITQQMLPQLQQRALRDLVEERLKLQEAKEFDLKPEDGEVDAELRNMAAQSGMLLEDFTKALESEGVSVSALRSQITSQIVWPRLVQGRYGKRVRVNDDEVEATFERMHADATQEQFLISEICIPVPSPDQVQTYYEGGLQLLEQMRKGVPFAVVAQQFSACTTAAAGGDMGWIRSGELPPELDEAVRQLPPGAVTNPIPSEGAFMILAVRDKRAAVQQGEKSWTLAYASTPVSTGRAAARMALEKLKTAEACAGGRTLRQDLGADVGVAVIENVTLGSVDERFRPTIENLSRSELSEIVEADDNFHVLYACEVDEGLGIPSRSAIEDRLYSRQLERIAQQYLRDVERKSTVDIRLANPGAPGQQPAPPAPNG
ncbi:MAG: peptidylprolyl isomerase [Parvularculaceae bacterium]